MATVFDDDTLSAHLDGRLAPAEARAVEEAMARDPQVATRLARLGAADRAARDWFDDVARDAPAAAADLVRDGFARRRQGRRRRALGTGIAAWAAAAAVVAVALLGLDHEVDRRVADAIAQMRSERASDLGLLASAMQEVLETRASGTEVSFENARTGTRLTLVPRRTWKSESGHWCREFVETIAGEGGREQPVSVACRDDDGTWRRVRTVTSGPPVLPWLGPGPRTDL